MKFSHTVRFPMGRQYEMRELCIEADDTDFPEVFGLPVMTRSRYITGTLMQQALMFQVAEGYFTPASPEFKEAWRMATELKGTPALVEEKPKRAKAHIAAAR